MPLPSSGKAKAKTPPPEEVLQQGRDAFLNYDFEEAEELYDQYRALITKAKQPVDENFEIWERELELGSNFFDRVQKIIIIDSVAVSEDKFFEYYKLSDSSGKIGIISELIENSEVSENSPGFISEAEDYYIGTFTDENENLTLRQGKKLLDGTWEISPVFQEDFSFEGDISYPFMSADGQTLYFAAEGDESLGGYDIFVAQRDPLTDEYLQPLNLGMPFNSPYNDYMMVIDEETGLGWWVTDRNSEEGFLTLYIYLLEDIRKNYPDDTENLADFALITEFRATQEEGREEDYKKILRNLPHPKKQVDSASPEFTFDLGNGKIYGHFSDFRNKKAAELMKKYLETEKVLQIREINLEELRKGYSSNKSLGEKIMKEETEVENLRESLATLKNEVLRLEKSTR